MTDTSNVDDPNPDGAGDNQSPVSPEKGNSIVGAPQSSQEFLELKKGYARLESELKGLQSRQDKDKNEVQRFMEDVKAHVAKGLTLDEAEQAVVADRKASEKEELLYKIAQKVGVLDNSPQNVAGNNSNAADEAAKVFAKYGVDPNDPVAIGFTSLKGAELKAAVADYAFEKSKQPSLDSSAATSIQGSGGSAGKMTAEQAEAKYGEINVLYKEPTKNAAKIKALTKELADSGYKL
jgi:hypothetical protein